MFPLQTELYCMGNKTGDFSHEEQQRLLANKLPIGTIGLTAAR